MLFPHSRPALARLQAFASALLLAGSVLLIRKAPPCITPHSSCLYAQRLSADTCPPQPLPAALAPSPGRCAEFGVAKCPSLCTLWADLGDLPVPPPHSQIPITTLTVQLLGLGHSSVPLTTLLHEAGTKPSTLPGSLEPAGVNPHWKEEGKYLFCTEHPLKHLRCLNSSCIQHPSR